MEVTVQLRKVVGVIISLTVYFFEEFLKKRVNMTSRFFYFLHPAQVGLGKENKKSSIVIEPL